MTTCPHGLNFMSDGFSQRKHGVQESVTVESQYIDDLGMGLMIHVCGIHNYSYKEMFSISRFDIKGIENSVTEFKFMKAIT